MRVSDTLNHLRLKTSLNKSRSEMNDMQTQAATNKRINKPSDDPVATTKILDARTVKNNNDQFMKNATMARDFLNYTDQALDELTQFLVRAKELAISQANDASADKNSRVAVATEVSQIRDQVIQIGNRQFGNRYVFGGYQTRSAPFDLEGQYMGDRGEIMIEVDKGSYMPMNLPGNTVFLGENLNQSQVLPQEISQPQSVDGLAEAQKHNLRKDPKNEEEVVLRGPASVESSLAGHVQKEGEKPQPLNLGQNLFNMLEAFETGLRTNDKASIQDSIQRLDEAIDQVILSRSKLGSRVMMLESGIESLDLTNSNQIEKISKLEDVDTFSLFSDMSKNETALKATLSTSAKILQPTLLDFLR